MPHDPDSAQQKAALRAYNKRPVNVEMSMANYHVVSMVVTVPGVGSTSITAKRAGYGDTAEAVVWDCDRTPLFFYTAADARAFLAAGNSGTIEELDRHRPVGWELPGNGALVPDLADVIDYARRVQLNER
jgi:hypothetical protein